MLSEIAEGREGSNSPGVVVGSTDVVEDEHLAAEIEQRRERRRRKIIDELFETEKTYLQHLNRAHKVR